MISVVEVINWLHEHHNGDQQRTLQINGKALTDQEGTATVLMDLVNAIKEVCAKIIILLVNLRMR